MSITIVSFPFGRMKDINVQDWVRYWNSRGRQALRPCLAVGDSLFTTQAARISLFDSKMFLLILGGLIALLKVDVYSAGNTVPDL